MPKRCVVPNCKSGSRIQAKCSLFQVPKDNSTWKKWENAIPGHLKLSPTDVVCEKHFKEEEIRREWIKLDVDGKVIARVTYKHPQLEKLAVPSKFNAQTGKENCVPHHEYAKTPDQQPNPPINEVPLSVPGSASNNSQVEPSSMAVPVELRIAEKFDSQIPVEVPLSVEINDDITDVSSPVPVTRLSVLPMEESTCGPVTEELLAPQISPGLCTSYKVSKGFTEENSSVKNELSAYLPEEWSLQNVRTAVVQETMFTHTVVKRENDLRCPVIQKAVTLDADGRLQYFVYGRHVDPQDKNLEQTLRGKEALKAVLVRFRGMNICSGIGDINTNFAQPGTTYQDHVNQWRSKSCSLISKRKRCEACMKARKCIQQRTARLKNPSALQRITNSSNPVDRCKLSAMRIKLRRERCQKIRALDGVKHLKTCIKSQEAIINDMQDATIEKKFN